MVDQKASKTIPLLSLALILFVAIIGVMTLFRVPKNLQQAIDDINAAKTYIESSRELLEFQQKRLDSIIITNQNLLQELDTLKLSNDSIKRTINDRLKDANWYLNRIKKTIDQLPPRKPTNVQ